MFGTKKRFVLAESVVYTHRDYKKHSGQIVTIVWVAMHDDDEVVGYHIEAEDGWCGLAWLNELEDI